MIELLSLAGLGFLLGFRHAFEPDHLAAVSSLASRPGGFRTAARLGVAWGVGHTAAVGAAILLLALSGLRLPPALQSGADLLVAALLIGLGLSSLVRLARDARPASQEEHPHRHESDLAAVRGPRQSFGFGLAHGLAGSGAIVVLLSGVAATAGDKLAYFLPFGLGTIAGMLLVSLSVTGVAGAAAGRSAGWARGIRAATALASLLIGLRLAWQIWPEFAGAIAGV